MLTKNYANQLKTYKRKQIKFLNRSFWLNFDMFLIFLTSILESAMNANKENKVSIINISRENNIIENVQLVLEFTNNIMLM